MSDHPSTTPLDRSQSVESIIRAYPATAAVFRDHDIELCCSTGLSVRDAAYAAAADEEALCEALRAVIDTGGAIQF
jgi:iron-sulfur cluster repair protein YtfE (RIC family)